MRKLVQKVTSRETFYYRKLTDKAQHELDNQGDKEEAADETSNDLEKLSKGKFHQSVNVSVDRSIIINNNNNAFYIALNPIY